MAGKRLEFFRFFNNAAWKSLCYSLDMCFPDFADFPNEELWKQEVIEKFQHGNLCQVDNVLEAKHDLRIKQVAGVIVNVSKGQGGELSAVLKDPTGQIECHFHPQVVQEWGHDLQLGTAILLKQVAIYVSGRAPGVLRSLNIHPKNIVAVFRHDMPAPRQRPRRKAIDAGEKASTEIFSSSQKREMHSRIHASAFLTPANEMSNCVMNKNIPITPTPDPVHTFSSFKRKEEQITPLSQNTGFKFQFSGDQKTGLSVIQKLHNTKSFFSHLKLQPDLPFNSQSDKNHTADHYNPNQEGVSTRKNMCTDIKTPATIQHNERVSNLITPQADNKMGHTVFTKSPGTITNTELNLQDTQVSPCLFSSFKEKAATFFDSSFFNKQLQDQLEAEPALKKIKPTFFIQSSNLNNKTHIQVTSLRNKEIQAVPHLTSPNTSNHKLISSSCSRQNGPFSAKVNIDECKHNLFSEKIAMSACRDLDNMLNQDDFI